MRLGTGDVFGDMVLLMGQPRRADVRAAGCCRLLVLRRDTLHRFLKRHQELVDHLRRISDARLGRAASS